VSHMDVYVTHIRCARTPLCRTADLRLDCGSLYTNKSCHTWMLMLLTFGARGRRSVERRTPDLTVGPYIRISHVTHGCLCYSHSVRADAALWNRGPQTRLWPWPLRWDALASPMALAGVCTFIFRFVCVYIYNQSMCVY